MKFFNQLVPAWLFLFCIQICGQDPYSDTLIPVSFEEERLELCLGVLSDRSGYYIAYPTSLIDTITVGKFESTGLGFFSILDSLLPNLGLTYKVRKRQIFLRKSPDTYFLEGVIRSRSDSLPIPYASISFKGRPVGTISDFKGVSQWEVSRKYLHDTMLISSMGYARQEYPVKQLLNRRGKSIFLEEDHIEIEPIIVEPKVYVIETLGNSGNRTSGSLYVDTHGQQTALYIPNDKQERGDILSVGFFLSEEGNTMAPFRLRLYTVDSLTGKPSEDLISEILVAKPGNDPGWYQIDLRSFGLNLPKSGIFVAMEGIFPNDYAFYSSSEEFIELADVDNASSINDNPPASVSYGQRLGYNRRNAENTWHYSFSHTWYQLRKQKYGVLIQINVRFEKNRRKLFRRNHEKE